VTSPLVSLARPEDDADIAALLAASATPFDAREELERRYAKVWVARADTELFGVALTWEVADELQLIELFVAPSARRRGVGRALMSALMGDGAARGFRVAVLEVRRDNVAALALYGAFGFQLVGERKRYYADGEDAILMQRALGTEE
jgi:ribosomal-protein-alanine N-acetyltransferase